MLLADLSVVINNIECLLNSHFTKFFLKNQDHIVLNKLKFFPVNNNFKRYQIGAQNQ